MKKIFNYSCAITIFFFLGCSAATQRNYQSMSGNWHSVLRLGLIYWAGEKYDFNFHNDSFKVRIRSWSDEISYEPWNPCNKLNNVQYAAGQFEIDNNEIHFSGMFTDSLYNVVNRGCFRVGKYEDKYDYYYFKDSVYLGKHKNDNGAYDMSSELILKRGKE